MSLRQFLRILWARKVGVGLFTLIGLVVAILLSYLLPPRYTAGTDILIDFKGLDPVSGLSLPAQMLPGYMATQFDIIRSHNVALKVVRKLNLTEVPAIRQEYLDTTEGQGSIDDWLADLIVRNLELRPTRDSSVVALEYTSQDPRFSAAMADAFAQAYIDTNLELTVAPAKDTAVWFDEQLRQLRINLAQAQAKLSAYQREKGFSATDERLDVESSRLNELSAQHTNAQAAAADASTRQRQLSEFLERGASPETLPDILANPVIQNLKTQLANAQSRLEQSSSQLGANHPEIRRLKADIAEQRQQLEAEIRTVSGAISNAGRLAQRREAELAQAVATQKSKLLRVNEGRNELAVLLRDMESAQRALDVANARYTQENLQSRMNQANVMVLSKSVPPLRPSFPKLVLNIPLGILAGLFLGINFALLREYFDRRVRSVDDLTELDGVAVLGSVGRSRESGTAKARRGLPWRRLRPLSAAWSK